MTPLWITHCQINVYWTSLTLLARCMPTLNVLTMVPLCMGPVLLMISGLMRENAMRKKLELAKERAQAQDCWRFEAEASPVPVPTTAPTLVPTTGPCFPDGPVVSNNNSSESSDSHDNDSIVSAAAKDPFIAEVQRHCQRPRQDEGAMLGGQRRSKRLRQGRNLRPLYPLTGMVLKSSLLTKKPHTHALITQYHCSLGPSNLLFWPFWTPVKHPSTNLSPSTWQRSLLMTDSYLLTWIGPFLIL